MNEGETVELLKAKTWYAQEVMSYTIKPKDQTSGTIECYALYPNNSNTALEPYTEDGPYVFEYSEYNGTTVKIDFYGDGEGYTCTLATKPVTEFAFFNPAGGMKN